MITQADVDAGTVDNTATATATAPNGDAVTAGPDTTSTPTSDRRHPDPDQAGRPAGRRRRQRPRRRRRHHQLHFLVTNTGAVTLTDVTVNDPKVGAVDCPTTPWRRARSTTCTATYVITQADVDAGTVDNTATASATDPDGNA